jgi:hypothetical protein
LASSYLSPADTGPHANISRNGLRGHMTDVNIAAVCGRKMRDCVQGSISVWQRQHTHTPQGCVYDLNTQQRNALGP